MAYDQVRDVLKTVRAFHQELGEICQRLSRQTHDARLEFLMEIVRQHEQRFADVLGRYEREGTDGVLNTWLQYTPTEEVRTALDSGRLADANSIGEVAEVVWGFEQALTDLYRQLAESTAAPRVQELFNRLLEQEESKTGKYAWNLEDFQGGPIVSRETGKAGESLEPEG